MTISDELKELLWDAVHLRNRVGAHKMPHQLADMLDALEVALWRDKIGYTPENVGVTRKSS